MVAMVTDAADSHPLYLVKGMLTKFMRMLFPLEFRIDSLPNTGAVLPFHYPLMPGEMIYLPDLISGLGGEQAARDYFVLTAGHLAGRHEFGTFEFRLADMAGFEERGETGVEALDSYVASFEDSGLAGALLRLCESARIDAELARRYRGLAPRLGVLNSRLADQLRPFAFSTMLVRASLGLGVTTDDPSNSFIRRAGAFFAPLREAGVGVTQSARATGEMYGWLQELFSAVGAGADEALSDESAAMRDDLLSTLRGAESGGDGMSADEEVGDAGEIDQLNQLDASGRTSKGKGSRPLSPEEIRKLIEAGVKLRPAESSGGAEGEGMYLTQLKNKQAEELDALREQLGEIGTLPGAGRLILGRSRSQDSYYAYDEWDYLAGDYRRNWCRLREIPVDGEGADFFEKTLLQYSEMLPQVRRNFQRIRPASYRMVRGLEDGDELDFDRVIESRVMRHMGEIPDGRVYKARKKEARDVATLFLLDMSASTDEPIHRDPPRAAQDAGSTDADDWTKAWQRRPDQPQRPRRIIDVNKEALVIMAQALEEIGDSYAIMGFSGHGRDNVEFYVIKEFDQELSDEVKARVGAVEPKRSTRMGTAIRHVREKFKDVACRAKHVIMLSDGFPQDFDYGHDRRSNAYGIQDTMVALKELEMAGVLPFCITVDRTGHDYLRQMCAPSRYLVIDDISSLPRQLPKVYEQVVRW
jgi:nitric oxide reductase NorD protein